MNNPALRQPDEKTQWEASRYFLYFSLLIILLLCGVLAFTSFYNRQNLLTHDGYNYLLYTQTALESSFAEALKQYPDMQNYPPLLVIFMYSVGKLGLDYQIAALALNFIAIVLTAYAVLLAALRLYNDRVTALATALIFASLPQLYHAGCNILRDPLYWAESMWLLVLLLKMIDPREIWSRGKLIMHLFAFALLTALSIPTRKEGMFFSILCLILLSIFSPLSKKAKSTVIVLSILFSILTVLLIKINGVPWDLTGSYQRIVEGF